MASAARDRSITVPKILFATSTRTARFLRLMNIDPGDSFRPEETELHELHKRARELASARGRLGGGCIALEEEFRSPVTA